VGNPPWGLWEEIKPSSKRAQGDILKPGTFLREGGKNFKKPF